ncbi:hypothetical protein [Gordonia sp. MMO-8]|uniref:hypothetical protein n=1 Tax=Gordonia sp. MMO-8 TaxID=3127886 RepID=UPI00301631E4
MTSQKTMTARIPVDVADQLSAAIINARDTALAATIVPDPKPEPAPAAASTDIVFVSAPPTRDDARRSNRRYHEFAEALRARPGEWGQYPRQMQSTNSAATTAAKIARGIPNAFPITDAGRFDATSDGRTVYVRYLLGGEA